MIPIITAHEMARVEALAYADGAREIDYMETAGLGVADCVQTWIDQHALERVVFILAGKGNNGGDAYVAGCHLLQRGFTVIACAPYAWEGSSPLCQQMSCRFSKAGGVVQSLTDAWPDCGVILDGLVGTGFKGSATGVLAQIIQQANASARPILSIDIPSGVCGNTGEVIGPAIHAALTIYLEWPKLGMFIGQGWNYAGELAQVSLGLSEPHARHLHPIAELGAPILVLPPIQQVRHKYQAGYVIGVAGSIGMSGAALLSSLAVLKVGAGIIRLFHPQGMEWGSAPYEVIGEVWSGRSLDRICTEMKRAQAVFIGPGMGRDRRVQKQLQRLLPCINQPVVLDADALFALGENPKLSIPPQAILTPHRKEMEHILAPLNIDHQAPFYCRCQQYVEEKKVVLILKGAPTWIFTPGALPTLSTAGHPGMATAGAGDVLTGMLAGLLAQGLSPQQAALTGVRWHGLAGECAATDLTAYCLMASDILDYLPEALHNNFLGGDP